jgi:hypothetical protein
MKQFIVALITILIVSVAVAQVRLPAIGPGSRGATGPSGGGGGAGGGGGPPPTCLGVIDASVGCPLPMLGM